MTRSRATRLLTAPLTLTLSVGLGAAVPAHASSTTKQDPRNDVSLASLGGGIDLAAVQLSTLSRTTRIRATFRLHSPAPEGSLEVPGGMSLRFVESRRTWRIVEIATTDGILRGEACRHSGARSTPSPTTAAACGSPRSMPRPIASW